MKKVIAVLMALMLMLSVCALASADEYEGGDPQHSPEFQLHSHPEEGCDWSVSYAHGGIVEVATAYYSLKDQPENDAWGNFPNNGGGYTWIRLDGVSVGIETVTLTYSGTDASIYRLNVVVSVDADMNAVILGIGTNDVVPPEEAAEGPIHPLLMLASNPTTGYNWLPDNSYTEGLTIDSGYTPSDTGETQMVGVGGVENVLLTGDGGAETQATFSYLYAPPSEDGTSTALRISVLCHEDTGVEIWDFCLRW